MSFGRCWRAPHLAPFSSSSIEPAPTPVTGRSLRRVSPLSSLSSLFRWLSGRRCARMGARAAKLRRPVAWIWVATCFSYSPSIVACCLW
jgi:hypothetical protein